MPRLTSIVPLCLLATAGCTEAPRIPLPPPLHPRVGHYVDVAGSGDASGEPDSPWDIWTALRGAGGRVQPGDTIWLRAGTYGGSFAVSAGGTAGAPVVVRAFPGERVVFDGAGTSSSTFIVDADWVVVWGLELMNSDRNRYSERPDVVLNNHSHVKFVNLVIHDGGVAFYSGRDQSDVELYGSIIYDNGWQEGDRGHGHGVYVKSDLGPVVVRENVVFNQFGYGIHAYSDQGSGRINGIDIERNVSFGNGILSPNPANANLLAGGYDPADSLQVVDNLTYYASGAGRMNVQIGYDTVMNGAMAIHGNYFVGGTRVLDVGYWTSAQVEANTIIGDSVVQALRRPDTVGMAWSDNRYFRDPNATAWGFGPATYAFPTWQTTTGLGGTDTATSGRPSVTLVQLWPNRYEAGRATIVVYNWGGAGAVTVDLSGVLAPGDSFEVRDVQDLFGAARTGGIYGGGSVTMPLADVAPPVPVGFSSSPAPRTGPAFEVLLVKRREP